MNGSPFPGWLTRRTGNLLGVLLCASLIGYALFVQYGMGLEPCPLCILQRVSVITAEAFSRRLRELVGAVGHDRI